jgi:hypothetical protein
VEKTYKLEGGKKTCRPRGAARRGSQPHPIELRLKAVKLGLEEGFPLELVAQEAGVNAYGNRVGNFGFRSPFNGLARQ